MKIEELKEKMEKEADGLEFQIEKMVSASQYGTAHDLNIRRIEIQNILNLINHRIIEDKKPEFQIKKWTDEKIKYVFDHDICSETIIFRHLVLKLMLTKSSIAVTITSQGEEWYLDEPIKYNSFSVASAKEPALLPFKFCLRGFDNKYDNTIVRINFETTEKLKNYLLRMLQALEYAEYKIYGD